MTSHRHPSPSTITQRCVASVALVAVAGLLLAYVLVCHASVNEGKRWRAEQRATAHATYLSVQRRAHP